MWGNISIAFLLAFATAYVITPYTIRLARKIGALDMPKNERKVHNKAMPRLGGIAIIAGFLVSIIYLISTMQIEKTTYLIGIDNWFTQVIGITLGILVLGLFCFFDDFI